MNDFLQKMQILLRAESAIFRIHMQTAARQILLFAVGIVLILLAVAMLNIAIFMVLSENYGREAAALLVCGINAVLAVAVILIAYRTKPGPEAAMAREIRDLAATEINADVEKIRQNLHDVKTDVQRIGASFGGFIGGGRYTLNVLNHLSPLLDLMIGSLRKTRKAAPGKKD